MMNWIQPDLAYEKMGVLKAGQKWCAFDVGKDDAATKAKRFVMALWCDDPFDIPRLTDKPHPSEGSSDDLWYLAPTKIRSSSNKDKNHVHLNNCINIAKNNNIEMFGILKRKDNSTCSIDKVFRITKVTDNREDGKRLLKFEIVSDTSHLVNDSAGKINMPQIMIQPRQPICDCNNKIYYGPPGTGKTYKLTQLMQEKYEGRYKFVTFHQSYGYEDFVEGLRPILINKSKEDVDVFSVSSSNEPRQIGYEIKDGIFKEICVEARKQPHLRYAIFIDEINRGNVSKIFGELITLIEIDKRDSYKEGEKPFIEVTLPYSRENFSVPCNLDIIGTMNTADRSLAPLDIALRRRFEFVPLTPDTRAQHVDGESHSAPLAGLSVGDIDIRQMLEKINERIEVLSNRDRCIGHAYFIPLRGMDNQTKIKKLSLIFKDQIIPLLEEYFFDDWKKIGQVLGDHNKSDAEIRFIASEKINRSDLLGENKNERNEDSSVRYRLNPDVFTMHVANEVVYVGIYKKVPERADPVPPASPSESQ